MMRTLIAITLLALATSVHAGEPTVEQLQEEYLQTLAGYFEVELENVVSLRDSGLAFEDLPVVLTIWRRAEISPLMFTAFRKQGDSWKDILKVRGIDPGIFFMMISAKVTSPTYAPTFEKFNGTPPSHWKQMLWTDDEIVNMANLRMISSHHDYSVFAIMEQRDQGHSFLQINHDVRAARAAQIQADKKRRHDSARAARPDGG